MGMLNVKIRVIGYQSARRELQVEGTNSKGRGRKTWKDWSGHWSRVMLIIEISGGVWQLETIQQYVSAVMRVWSSMDCVLVTLNDSGSSRIFIPWYFNYPCIKSRSDIQSVMDKWYLRQDFIDFVHNRRPVSPKYLPDCVLLEQCLSPLGNKHFNELSDEFGVITQFSPDCLNKL